MYACPSRFQDPRRTLRYLSLVSFLPELAVYNRRGRSPAPHEERPIQIWPIRSQHMIWEERIPVSIHVESDCRLARLFGWKRSRRVRRRLCWSFSRSTTTWSPGSRLVNYPNSWVKSSRLQFHRYLAVGPQPEAVKCPRILPSTRNRSMLATG